MKKVLLGVLVCMSSVANATGTFDATKNMSNQITITWLQVDNVTAACDAESKRRGNGGFGYALDACSFWPPAGGPKVCTIITGKRTDLDTLGHETRHCFQGNWHKEP
jgi:hypothetical protein